MSEIHPELRDSVWRNQYVGTPLLGVVAAGIFWFVGRAFVSGEVPLPLVALLVAIGLLFTWAAWYAWSSVRWYQRTTWVLRHTEPVLVRVQFGMNEAGGLIALLYPVQPGHSGGWQIIMCSDAQWDHRTVEGAVVRAHIDPSPGGPVVLETERGRIWPLERAATHKIEPGRRGA